MNKPQPATLETARKREEEVIDSAFATKSRITNIKLQLAKLQQDMEAAEAETIKIEEEKKEARRNRKVAERISDLNVAVTSQNNVLEVQKAVRAACTQVKQDRDYVQFALDLSYDIASKTGEKLQKYYADAGKPHVMKAIWKWQESVESLKTTSENCLARLDEDTQKVNDLVRNTPKSLDDDNSEDEEATKIEPSNHAAHGKASRTVGISKDREITPTSGVPMFKSEKENESVTKFRMHPIYASGVEFDRGGAQADRLQRVHQLEASAPERRSVEIEDYAYSIAVEKFTGFDYLRRVDKAIRAGRLEWLWRFCELDDARRFCFSELEDEPEVLILIEDMEYLQALVEGGKQVDDVMESSMNQDGEHVQKDEGEGAGNPGCFKVKNQDVEVAGLERK
ncbi:hypothetical protein MMC25_000544 [Agyrium rufum]|nr:hypothetical protein [Agyrium rufum]